MNKFLLPLFLLTLTPFKISESNQFVNERSFLKNDYLSTSFSINASSFTEEYLSFIIYFNKLDSKLQSFTYTISYYNSFIGLSTSKEESKVQVIWESTFTKEVKVEKILLKEELNFYIDIKSKYFDLKENFIIPAYLIEINSSTSLKIINSINVVDSYLKINYVYLDFNDIYLSESFKYYRYLDFSNFYFKFSGEVPFSYGSSLFTYPDKERVFYLTEKNVLAFPLELKVKEDSISFKNSNKFYLSRKDYSFSSSKSDEFSLETDKLFFPIGQSHILSGKSYSFLINNLFGYLKLVINLSFNFESETDGLTYKIGESNEKVIDSKEYTEIEA